MVSGLPRSGSTLLMNLLGQNPNVHVTPTSGAHEVLWSIKNNWMSFQEHRADKKASDVKNLQRILKAILNEYHDTDKEIIFDKHRSWLHSIEMLEFILEEKCKIIVPVRSISEILASFEKLYRKNAHINNVPGDFLSSQTTFGRVSHWASNKGELGIAYNRLMDVFNRGYGDRLLLVEYEMLTRHPEFTMSKIWEYLNIDPIIHDFDNVTQITHEDDLVIGIPGLHDIRSKVEPTSTKPEDILGLKITEQYKNSEFWRFYHK